MGWLGGGSAEIMPTDGEEEGEEVGGGLGELEERGGREGATVEGLLVPCGLEGNMGRVDGSEIGRRGFAG